MIFPHINVKNARKFQSHNSRMKKISKVAFQALPERLISVIYYKNPKSQNLLLALEFISRVYLELCDSTVVTKSENV